MKKLISNFTKQLKNALEISKESKLTPFDKKINNVIISGMGGSGIGGNIISETTASEIKIPIIVNKDYNLPNFANTDTLVIISSYSGDTEETLKSFEEAIKKNAKIVCITSGGKIGELAKEKNIDNILIPKGMPPRAAIAYSVTQILHTLHYYDLISNSFEKDLQSAIKLIDVEEKNITRDAKETANILSGKFPIIYGAAKMESVALRFRQQLNENSKLLCWHNVFPELDHNELQGWKKKNNNSVVVIFRNDNDSPRTAKRIDISSEIISHCDTEIKEVYSKGNSILERILYLINWGDWVSYFIAEMTGTDTMDIRAITYLKSELAKVEEY